MKYLLIPALIALLSGCVDTAALLQRNPTMDQFYTLDTQKLQLCRGTSTVCYDVGLIASSREHAGAIEEAYQSKLQGPNYPLSLVRMMITPPNHSYVATPVEGSSTSYRLPINAQTDSVWQMLKHATYIIYDAKTPF